MKGNWKFSLGVITGACLVVASVLLIQISKIQEPEFLEGCLSMLLLGLMVMVVYAMLKQNLTGNTGRLPRIETEENIKEISIKRSEHRKVLRFIFLGLLGIGCFFFGLNRYYTSRLKSQEKTLRYLTDENAFLKEVGFDTLLTYEIRRIDEELGGSINRALSDISINRIAALSEMLGRTNELENDSFDLAFKSAERGHLLKLLVALNIDTASMRKLLLKADFSGAVLEGASLDRAFLPGIQLEYADMKNVILEEANLDGANLHRASMWGARLNRTSMKGAKASRVDLSWSQLNSANLDFIDLYAADVTSAQMKEVSMKGARLQSAEMYAVILHNAILEGADLWAANCKRAQLDTANLSGANLKMANLSEADVTHTILEKADLTGMIISNEDWLRSLQQWNVVGAAQIQLDYRIVDEKAKNGRKFHLERQPIK